MPKRQSLSLQKVVRTATFVPELDEVPASKQAHKRATQQVLLGANLPPSAASTVIKAAQESKAHARATEIAKTAMGLRSLAIAAEALRKLPGGGAAADTLLRSLDAAVNKGGKIAVKAGKLVRKKPELKATGQVEVGWFGAVLTVAPFAMRAIGPAVAAAKSGLAKFGPALAANLTTAARFVASKVGPLLSKATALPGMAAAANLAKKALKVAGVALGVGTVAAVSTAKGREALAEGGRRAMAIARQGTIAVAKGAEASAQEAADQAADAAKPDWWESAKTYAPYALGALLLGKVLL